MAASRTSIDVTAERCRPATPDGAQNAQLLIVQPWTSIDEAIALLAE